MEQVLERNKRALQGAKLGTDTINNIIEIHTHDIPFSNFRHHTI